MSDDTRELIAVLIGLAPWVAFPVAIVVLAVLDWLQRSGHSDHPELSGR